MTDAPDYAPPAEAKQAALTAAYMNLIADRLTAALPDEIRDAGLRFEWH